MSQVSDGRSEQMLRARLLLSRVLVLCSDRFKVRWVCDGSIRSGLDRCDALRGAPCFPFYRPRESMGYSRGKEKNEREEKSFRIVGSFFSFMWDPPTL